MSKALGYIFWERKCSLLLRFVSQAINRIEVYNIPVFALQVEALVGLEALLQEAFL